MNILLITPAPAAARNGNRMTAVRWTRILRDLGHRVTIRERYDGTPCDLMIALHALRSFESIRRFHEDSPELPLVVTLTGTDLYRDIKTRREARLSLEWASRLVVLQAMGVRELPPRLRRKTRVIYQSAAPVNGRSPDLRNSRFKVCVIGHLRPEKDPLRTAMAVRRLPRSSRTRVLHIGRALSEKMKEKARTEAARNARYRWFGELPHWKTRKILATSHLVALTSRIEGSSNVLSEAIASSVPVIAAKIPGLMGTLGEGYPGYFPVGDTRALEGLLQKAETEPAFYRRLKTRCQRLAPLVSPERERASWKKLLAELS